MSTLNDTFVGKTGQYKDVAVDWDMWITRKWRACSISGDGLVALAAVYEGRLRLSGDSGKTWSTIDATKIASGILNWMDCDVDYDGSVLVACCTGSGGRVYLSTDGGVTWVDADPAGDASDHNWYGVACDADGSHIVAVEYGGRVWLSTNSGASFSEIRPDGDSNYNWYGVAVDSDCSVIFLGVYGGRLWLSTNTGSSFTEPRPKGDTNGNWRSLACDSDGSVLIAGDYNVRTWKSSNTGSSWAQITPIGDSNTAPTSICTNSTGSTIIHSTTARPRISYDGGTSWTYLYLVGSTTWAYIGSDIDDAGEHIVACFYNGPLFASSPRLNGFLPIVYGTLSASKGIWELPILHTHSYVYCYAAHEVLSVANGNSVQIYKDGVLVDPSNYTFDESNDLDGLGNIATVTFTTSQGSSVITACGMGKPTEASGDVIMDNIIDIVYDLLTVEGDFASSVLEATSKAKASQVFDSQSYKAAGVVMEDREYFELVIEQMASFLGNAYQNGDGELVLDIDDGTSISSGAPIISKGEVTLIGAVQKLSNVNNQIPCDYAYNYFEGVFDGSTDDTAHADLASQGVFEVQSPESHYEFYWCRDLTSVQTMQDILVDKLAWPLYEIEIEVNNLKYMDLDLGHVFCCTIDSLYDTLGSPLYNQYWKVVSVKYDFQKATMKIRALQTSSYLTKAGVRDTTDY